MSSPNHPTSDIEDVFSSNFPDYFSASPGNTSSESLNNSSGLVPIASPTLSLFHNDPYMKVMQAYDAISPPQISFLPKSPPPKDTETPIESPIPISPSSSVGSSLPVRSTTPPPDYPFNEFIFAELDNSLWIIPRPLGSEPVPDKSNEMAPKRTSTSAAPPMTQATIKKLVADSVAVALEAQAATMASTSNPNRNTRPTGMLGKMEDEFYNLTVKGDDLKTYIRRFQELAVLCPNMVPNTEKLMEAFIRVLPRSIEGNVTVSKPQTLEEAINITQRLMDQVTRHNSVLGTNDHK
ncbi:hypothetical protein Tco_0838527 [Tanacetum coccineum]|uniref:Reverse transcriptase domain-containing protein n=1 Tax=Tanacetum coccineum TaxID=301880 RepID=A0ABQ5AN21_9ASTR